jgi:site-specific DNA recombinase
MPMVRVALYARYSSDQQRAASIEDQLRICREHSTSAGWTIVAEHTDPGLSGASMLTRPGLQALMRAALTGECEVVLAESLDRFSRDQADSATFFKKMNFAGVQIMTIAEGAIGHLHIGLKGTMNALYLHELAQKTRRGLRGRVEAGRSGGGLSYGYRVVRALVEGERGEREIDPTEAAVVARIFRSFVAGVSPKQIAKSLNRERVPGPAGAGWSPSTINGNVSRGTGILNNELYVGRIVWNRQRFFKDPDTGKRVPRPNPPSEWITKEVPHLRVIDDELWQAAKARQAETRQETRKGIVRARRPIYLFSGLTKCGVCGGGFTLSSHDLLTCFNARDRGTCTNRRSIKRQEVEARVLRAMKERFFEPDVFAEFCAGFTEAVNERRRDHRAKLAAAPREIASLDRRSKEIMNLLLQGFRDEAWKEELRSIEERRTELKALIASAETDPPLPALHPHMADVFRDKIMLLAAALEHDVEKDAARQALRGLIDRIVIPPGDGLLQVVGDLGEMLTAASNTEVAAAVGYGGCGGPQPTVFGVRPDRRIVPTHTFSKRARSTTPTSLRFRINELRAVWNSVARNPPSNASVARCDLDSAVYAPAKSDRPAKLCQTF